MSDKLELIKMVIAIKADALPFWMKQGMEDVLYFYKNKFKIDRRSFFEEGSKIYGNQACKKYLEYLDDIDLISSRKTYKEVTVLPQVISILNKQNMFEEFSETNNEFTNKDLVNLDKIIDSRGALGEQKTDYLTGVREGIIFLLKSGLIGKVES